MAKKKIVPQTEAVRGPWHLEPLQWDQGASIAICGPGDYGILATIQAVNAEDEPDINTAKREPYDEANAQLMATSPRLLEFVELIARMKTEGECDDMESEDWIATLNNLIRDARKLSRTARAVKK